MEKNNGPKPKLADVDTFNKVAGIMVSGGLTKLLFDASAAAHDAGNLPDEQQAVTLGALALFTGFGILAQTIIESDNKDS